MYKLTRKQRRMMAAIESFITQHNYPPTVRELAAAVGLKSSGTVHGYLNRLKSLSMIQWEPERPRTLKVIKYEEVGERG